MSYIGRPPEYGGYEKQDITPDGSTTTFALDYSVGTESSLLVSVAGVPQQPGTAYTLSGGGANVVFSAAPASGATVFVIFLGYAFDAGVFLATGTITGQTSLGAQPASADAFLIYDDSASALKKVTYTNLIPTTHGDVSGPASSTDNALAKYDSTTGKIIQNSTATLSDAGTLTATAFAGALTGNVTGNASGTAATVTGGTQASITSAANLVTVGTIGTGVWQGTAVADAYLGSTINAIKLADGTVTNAEFQYINTLSSNAQTQLDAKPVLTIAQEWTAQQNFNNTALTFDATQDWALTANQVTTLTLTANTIFDAPTQMVDGSFYSILIIQDGTGSRTASWPTATFKWAAGTAPVLTTTASAKDLFVFRSNGTLMYEVGRQLNLS